MANFVSLTHDNAKDTIHVNMDRVITMERIQDKYTAITFEVGKAITVKETPSQIMDLIHRERKT
jgi:hypothetical protein